MLGVGFLYILKNPSLLASQIILSTLNIDLSEPAIEWIDIDLTNCTSYFDGCNTCSVQSWTIGWCTKMFCETPAEPQCLEYIWTGMDLTNCTSYFDGCNNCTVENGKPSACTLMYCETPSEPKCLVFASGADTTSMANPASVNCTTKWWTLNIVTQTDGSQLGMCTLANGDVCEERAYMRGECGVPQQEQTSPTNPGNEEEATMCTMQYEPVCASVEVQCIKAPCPPVQQTFGNKCMMNANKKAFFLHDGECTTK